jgi:hypothetical protein
MISLRTWKVLACCSASLILLLSLLVPPQACAQVSGATISGTVTDSTGATIPNAQVVIEDVDTAIKRTTTTDSAGFYTAPNLLPDPYKVTVTAKGFSTVEQTGITLTVGAQQVLNFNMTVGQVAQTVEVTAAAPSIALSTSDVGSEVDSTSVRELPLNGRDWTQLAVLQPGVTSVGSLQISTTSFQRGNRGFGTQMAISGSRPQQNNFRLDGISVNDYVNSGPGSVLGIALGVDAIAEFAVISSNYSAEYGRTSGGVVNAISRSGSNQLHGSAYFFMRDEDFDTRNFFDRPGQKPPFHRDQYGGSIGGPIWKDRTFFFVDYEGLGQNLGLTNVNVVPSLAARSGNIHNSSGAPITVPVDPLVALYLPFYGLPNAGLLGNGDTGNYDTVTQRQNSENFYDLRIDHKVSDSDSLFGTYQFDKGPVSQPDALLTFSMSSVTLREYAIIEETHTFRPGLINAVRGGYNLSEAKNAFGVFGINPLAANYAICPGCTGPAPSVIIGGLTSMTGGLTTNASTQYHFNDWQLYDDAFYTRGIHSVKFGFAAERIQENYSQGAGASLMGGGQFRFGSLSAFLQNQPNSFRGGNATPVLPFYLRQSVYGGYVQDDVRLRPSFTVNLGLRNEMSTVPTEINNRLAAIGTQLAPAVHTGNPYFFNPTLRNFEPRVGFAWDPFHNGKTSVRAGFGQFDVLPLTYEYAILAVGTYPYVLGGNASPLPAGSFPIGAIALVQTAGVNTARVSYIQQNPKRNYVLQWNLNVQRQLTPSLSGTVSYVGNRGVHQPFRGDDVDIVQPTLTSAGYLWPLPVGSGTRQNPNFGRSDILAWTNSTFFDALEVQLVKRMSRGFQIQGSYTWGKSIDLGSGSTHGDPYATSISADWYFPGYQRLDRGLSDFNVAQHIVISYTWNLPSPKSESAIISRALGGWELGGIFTAQTGLPFTPEMTPDPLGTKSTLSYAFPDRVSGAGCGTAVNSGQLHYIKTSCFALPTAPASFASQCATFTAAVGPAPSGQVYCANLLGNVGRNSLIGPGIINMDFSLFKNFPIKRISEGFNAQFRAEVFNIVNHANFDPPTNNMQVFNATGAPLASAGLLDTTSTTSRQMQFAVKLTW